MTATTLLATTGHTPDDMTEEELLHLTMTLAGAQASADVILSLYCQAKICQRYAAIESWYDLAERCRQRCEALYQKLPRSYQWRSLDAAY